MAPTTRAAHLFQHATFPCHLHLLMSEPLPSERVIQDAQALLSVLTRDSPPGGTAPLRDLLGRLDAVLAQEALLSRMRLHQPPPAAGGTPADHQQHFFTYHLWRELRSYGYELMQQLSEAVRSTLGPFEAEADIAPAPAGLRTAYAPVRQVYLVYPEQVSEGQTNYSFLTPFYERLLQAIPAELEVVLFVKTREIASRLRKQALRRYIRYVVHSELESIWLRDYAGFHTGTHLVKPISYPKRLGDSMKLLHSLLEVDMTGLDLVWDGGNLVTNGQYGFISTRLQEHNKPRTLEQLAVVIRDNLGIEPMWVELPPADKLAHTDGYMAFISPTKALVSTYAAEWTQAYEEDQACVDKLARQLQELGLEVERILEYPDFNPGKSTVDSAVGIYVNLLQLNGTWLVPTYNLPGEAALLTQLRRLNPAGTIVPLDCTELAQLGGVLHCITFCS
jgi:agmatine/peptidylarginine deiminase